MSSTANHNMSENRVSAAAHRNRADRAEASMRGGTGRKSKNKVAKHKRTCRVNRAEVGRAILGGAVVAGAVYGAGSYIEGKSTKSTRANEGRIVQLENFVGGQYRDVLAQQIVNGIEAYHLGYEALSADNKNTIDADSARSGLLAEIQLAAGSPDPELTFSNVATTSFDAASSTQLANLLIKLGAAEAQYSGIIAAEVKKLQERDAELEQKLDAEATARADADNTLTTRVQAEETARADADTALTTRVETEETARADADTTLTTRVQTEEAAREDADNTLTTRVQTEEAAREDADNTLTTRVQTEEAAREDADNTLTTRVQTEEAAREDADNTLTSRVQTEEAAREDADNTLTTRVQTEEAARADADTALDLQIDGNAQFKYNGNVVEKFFWTDIYDNGTADRSEFEASAFYVQYKEGETITYAKFIWNSDEDKFDHNDANNSELTNVEGLAESDATLRCARELAVLIEQNINMYLDWFATS